MSTPSQLELLTMLAVDYAPPAYPPPSSLLFGRQAPSPTPVPVPHPPTTTFPTPCDLLTELAAPRPPSHGRVLRPKKVETQRNARRRAVAESIGFLPTDPDTISSHDKKRHYLECLEEYVSYLHGQLRSTGQEPPQLERISTYQGLNNRSIRTLLIYMQDHVRDLHVRTLVNEQHFLNLQSEALAQEYAGWQDVPPQPQSQPLQMGYPLPVSHHQWD
ncbi:hypothetical protein EVG20_g9869 [Dentipellis fragilis]|uniref:Uncharacterized protein n=1 Tax=Dentipellis fragilis TaxID=205917 RepID=A0A4Y9XUU8_9AGAM|nr:hypothetical protein EVG20_g9869 [Dentipellis fragilis]